MKILACADIHMGRIPSVNGTLKLTGHSSWDAVVQKAIELAVDVLVLAGDVVEQENAWLSVYGPLLKGLERLKEAGIQAIAVGGNHDHAIFPQLAKDSDAITLLGLHGTWEAYDYKQVRFIGWSFPSGHVQINPFATFTSDLTTESVLTLGLLHTEVGTGNSAYAGTKALDFDSRNVDLWMLGHIHKKGQVEPTRSYYCGSPYALDSGEMGEHGVYLLETENNQWKDPVFLPLCPYRFETCSVSVAGLGDSEAVRSAIRSIVREMATSMGWSGSIYVKLQFEGELNLALDLESIMGCDSEDGVPFLSENGCMVFLLSPWMDHTTLELDIEKLSKVEGPIGLLASYLVDPEKEEKLVALYLQYDKESRDSSAFSLLGKKKAEREVAVLEAKQAVYRLLRNLVGQMQGGR